MHPTQANAEGFPAWSGCSAQLLRVEQRRLIEKLKNGYAEFEASRAEHWRGWGIDLDQFNLKRAGSEYVSNGQKYKVQRALGVGFHSAVFKTESQGQVYTVKHFHCEPHDLRDNLRLFHALTNAGLPVIPILSEQVISLCEMIHVYPYVKGIPLDYVFEKASVLGLTATEVRFLEESFDTLQTRASLADNYFESSHIRTSNVLLRLDDASYLIIDGN